MFFYHQPANWLLRTSHRHTATAARCNRTGTSAHALRRRLSVRFPSGWSGLCRVCNNRRRSCKDTGCFCAAHNHICWSYNCIFKHFLTAVAKLWWTFRSFAGFVVPVRSGRLRCWCLYSHVVSLFNGRPFRWRWWWRNRSIVASNRSWRSAGLCPVWGWHCVRCGRRRHRGCRLSNCTGRV